MHGSYHVPVLSWRGVVSEQSLGGVALVQFLGHPVVGKYHTLSNYIMHLQRLQVMHIIQICTKYRVEHVITELAKSVPLQN